MMKYKLEIATKAFFLPYYSEIIRNFAAENESKR